MNYHAGMYKLQGSAIYILCKTSQFDSWTEKFEEVYHRLYFGVSQTLVGDAKIKIHLITFYSLLFLGESIVDCQWNEHCISGSLQKCCQGHQGIRPQFDQKS